MITVVEKAAKLRKWGFVVGDRNPQINTKYPGKFMVAEYFEESELPTEDGRNGPWCIVGNNLDALITEAYDIWYWDYELDGTSGQDRESYTDDQDRDSYKPHNHGE